MPRANRHQIAGQIWHITQRCHEQQFLLRFARDRRRWLSWLFEAKQRFGLCVLDYVVTSNHVHLLVRDRDRGEIPRAMQLVAGRTAQEYNLRTGRRGGFWEDRYHSTAVDTDEHFTRCLTYIDTNMVRAGAVSHPIEWETSGYREIQRLPTRYRITDVRMLLELLELESPSQLKQSRREWVDAETLDPRPREPIWTQSVAVGRREFVERVRTALGSRGRYRQIESRSDGYALREAMPAYKPVS